MEWLWSRWPEVEARIRGGGHTLLLLDYDGTLAAIAPSPERAELPHATRSILRRLARNRKVTVALISGRALDDLRRMVRLQHLTYVGNHGLEMWRNGTRMRVPVPPPCKAAIARLRPRLADLVAGVRGARLEDKGLSLTVHYRLVRPGLVARFKAACRAMARSFVRSGTLTIRTGKKVVEFRPGIAWTKGDAALWVIRRVRRRLLLPVVIGDDRTDEDAFGALAGGITIRVGAARRSKARYFVRNVGEVASFLEWMAACDGRERRAAS
jgi:trehalose-phosphatase